MSASLLAEFDSFYRQAQDSDPSRGDDPDDLAQRRPTDQTESRLTVQQPDSGRSSDSTTPWLQEQSQDGILDTAAEDDWGEFESGQKFDSPAPSNVIVAFDDSHSVDEHQVVEGLSALDFDIGISSNNNEAKNEEPFETTHSEDRPPRDENVLFDVDDEFDDDFGDFETAETASSVSASQNPGIVPKNLPQALIDFDIGGEESINAPPKNGNLPIRPAPGPPVDAFSLLEEDWPQAKHADSEIELVENTQNLDQIPSIKATRPQLSEFSSEDFSDWDMDTNNTTSQSETEQAKTIDLQRSRLFDAQPSSSSNNDAANPSDKNEDHDWDEFEEGAISETTTTSNYHSESALGTDGTSGTANDTEESRSNPQLPSILQSALETAAPPSPPINVPPPAILLSLFPRIFSRVQSSLYEPMGRLTDDSKTRGEILSQENTKEFLRSYVGIITVLARIIAGRKLRWKRDTILSQSMRIGPASSGKTSGMKLTGVDKGESVKEDKEVADVVRIWRTQAGRLRSVISGSGVKDAVPEISEVLPVRVAQQSEGAISAPKPCVLCALKRNERIPKIDTDIQDSFGEFWAEHWGHAICMKFWYSYEQELASR